MPAAVAPAAPNGHANGKPNGVAKTGAKSRGALKRLKAKAKKNAPDSASEAEPESDIEVIYDHGGSGLKLMRSPSRQPPHHSPQSIRRSTCQIQHMLNSLRSSHRSRRGRIRAGRMMAWYQWRVDQARERCTIRMRRMKMKSRVQEQRRRMSNRE